MFKHFLSIWDDVRIYFKELILFLLAKSFNAVVRIRREPIWNVLDRQVGSQINIIAVKIFKRKYSDRNTWTASDLSNLKNWGNEFSGRTFIWMKIDREHVTTRWIANWQQSISKVDDDTWMVAEKMWRILSDVGVKTNFVWVLQSWSDWFQTVFE